MDGHDHVPFNHINFIYKSTKFRSTCVLISDFISVHFMQAFHTTTVNMLINVQLFPPKNKYFLITSSWFIMSILSTSMTPHVFILKVL